MKDLRFYGLTILGLVLFPFAIHPIGGYAGLATQILITSIASMGFNLLLGYTGILSYGQAMFYGLAGYVALLTISRFFPDHANFWVALILATAFATLVAVLVGALVVRLYGIYFALLTVAFAQMFYFVVFKWTDLTGGDDGLQGVTVPAGTVRIRIDRPHDAVPIRRSRSVRKSERRALLVCVRRDRHVRDDRLLSNARAFAVR